eukprot:9569023-Ditylum_brightwellii.AAC.1
MKQENDDTRIGALEITGCLITMLTNNHHVNKDRPQRMVAGRFKVPKEKAAANDANIDPVFQTEAQNCKENPLEDGKMVLTEMPEDLDNDLSIGDEDNEDLCANMDV